MVEFVYSENPGKERSRVVELIRCRVQESRQADQTSEINFDTLIRGEDVSPVMTEVARLRDSTQITLPSGALAGLQTDLEEQFMVSVREEDPNVRIIGSPVEIKSVCDFLARNGIPVA